MLLVLAGACGGSDVPVEVPDPNLPPDGDYPLTLATLATRYAPAQTVRIYLRNDGPARLAYDFCGQPLERRVQDGWVTVPRFIGPCPAILVSIEPGIAIVVGYELPAGLRTGEYRVRGSFSTLSGPWFARRTNAFAVQ